MEELEVILGVDGEERGTPKWNSRWWQGKASGSFQRVMTRQIKCVCPVAMLWLVGMLMRHGTLKPASLEVLWNLCMSPCPPNIRQQIWTWQHQRCLWLFWVLLTDLVLEYYNPMAGPRWQVEGEDQEDSLNNARVDPPWLVLYSQVRPSRHQVCSGKRVRWPELSSSRWKFAFAGW